MVNDVLMLGGADFEDVGSVCMITSYTANEVTVISQLAILRASYFGSRAELTCVGENGVDNIVHSPERATAHLIILCELPLPNCVN